jgi:hypothetical protein
MKQQRFSTTATFALVTVISSGLLAPSVQARDYDRYERHERFDRHERYPRYPRHDRYERHYRPVYPARPYHRPPRGWGHPRPYYYGYPYVTDKAFKYLGITAVALGFLDLLDANQQRRHEAALIAAANRPGEVIVWESGDASGTVETTRVGTSSTGRQCREFQQTVTVGGRTEQAYGTACLQPDGDWEIIETR